MEYYDKIVKRGHGFITPRAISGVLHLGSFMIDCDEVYLSDLDPDEPLYFEGEGGSYVVVGVTDSYSDELCFGISEDHVVIEDDGEALVITRLF